MPPLLSTDLEYYSQRLYARRLKAVAKAKSRLQNTAYTILDVAKQATILSAVNLELRNQVEIIMPRLTEREVFPYNDVIEAVIKKVFYDKIALFQVAGEDNSTLDELL